MSSLPRPARIRAEPERTPSEPPPPAQRRQHVLFRQPRYDASRRGMAPDRNKMRWQLVARLGAVVSRKFGQHESVACPARQQHLPPAHAGTGDLCLRMTGKIAPDAQERSSVCRPYRPVTIPGLSGRKRLSGGAGHAVRRRPGVQHFLCHRDRRAGGSLYAHPAFLQEFAVGVIPGLWIPGSSRSLSSGRPLRAGPVGPAPE